MALPHSGIIIPRQSVVGSEGFFTKMFDPPTDSPPTPDRLDLCDLPAGVNANPVPEIMLALGLQDKVSTPHTVQRDLMHGLKIETWDGLKELEFFVFRDKDNPSLDGNYPAGTIRVPRGAIFHAESQGHGPPPHTIHWHGIEPTAINDGVGHCSMEIGDYTYQWQPNFIGTYFYHCHRNTVQHFEFGLFGLLLIHPPDAFFASTGCDNSNSGNNSNDDNGDNCNGSDDLSLNSIPIGAGRDGKFRTAANLLPLPRDIRNRFPGFIAGDPVLGVATPDPLGQFRFDPHAYTVPYDVEALWVLDDRDSVWSELADDPRATFPRFGSVPGVNDEFDRNPGENGFFNFNDYNADYWFITGVPVPAHKGGTAVIDPAGPPPAGGGLPGGLIPPALNSGVGMLRRIVDPTKQSQISINAKVGQTVFVRCLDAAYNSTRITFPVDVVIIDWDGRALGVPPLSRYTRPILIRAGTPITISTARRFGAIFNLSRPVNSFAKVEFLDTRSGAGISLTGGGDVLVTARIPIIIS